MPSLKAIRRRIVSVKNTQKITKAMKAVAAARLRKAQDAILALRPYAQKLDQVIAEVAARRPPDEEPHPLLAVREPKRVALIVLTSDRGLAGGFNANINRAAERFIREHRAEYEKIELNIVGRKGREYFKRRNYEIHDEYMGVFSEVSVERAREITIAEIEDYTANGLDAVYLVYNEFKSAMSQRVVIEKLLPVEPAKLPESAGQVEYKFEPSRHELLDHLLPLHVETQIYRA